MSEIAARDGYCASPWCVGQALAFIIVFCAAASSGGAELAGRVVRVADGDTITVLDHLHVEHKVRLSGIDAPEMNQPYGAAAKHHLAELVYGKAVIISWHKHDRYRRIVGRVLVTASECASAACAHGLDAGLDQISSGYAWHYKQYESEQSSGQRRTYAAAEREAQVQRHGLWADRDAVPPWEFRHQHRGHAA